MPWWDENSELAKKTRSSGVGIVRIYWPATRRRWEVELADGRVLHEGSCELRYIDHPKAVNRFQICSCGFAIGSIGEETAEISYGRVLSALGLRNFRQLTTLITPVIDSYRYYVLIPSGKWFR